ncbi:transmembrane protein, putative (macronuclear) [Tetrahymena thermophila SB210]|uniref:Transmembrane protein, putative n=1 Tax=Tetrahymena thermophila (strain SB210) TaxID=312017 RepID=I7LT59_TETTS|nr:transmembrane protein, putative [Tetrahymena thermophila SB210]EAR84449.2 transmembrane protein, putative [Tetrahymena thermophila SB210]|eukprot:XP_001032112.2 transmembrane protein, putative [Tetrahymena thermophila SB210]
MIIQFRYSLSISPNQILLIQANQQILVFSQNDQMLLLLSYQIIPFQMTINLQVSTAVSQNQNSQIILSYDQNLSQFLVQVDSDFFIFDSNLQILYNDSLKSETKVNIQNSIQKNIFILNQHYVFYNQFSIAIISKSDLSRVAYREFEDISYIKSIIVNEKRIVLSTQDQQFYMFATPNLLNIIEKIPIEADEIIYNKETREYLYQNDQGETFSIYFNDYLIKKRFQDFQQINKMQLDSVTGQILMSSYYNNTNIQKIKIYSKQILEDSQKLYSIDTNVNMIQNYTSLGFDQFLILNKEGSDYLIAALKWVQYDTNMNITSSLHSLVFYQYSSYKMLFIQMKPHSSQIRFLIQGGKDEIITVSSLNSIKIWNLTNFQLNKKINRLQFQINDVIYDQVDDMIIVCTSQPQLIFYDYQTLQILQTFSKFQRSCDKISLGLFRRNLIATESDGRIIIFNYKTMLPIQQIHLDTTGYSVLFLYPLFSLEKYNQILDYTDQKYKEKENEKKIVIGSQSGNIFVLSWKKIEFSNTNNPQMYLKEIQYGISEKYEYQLEFQTLLNSEIKAIIVDEQLDLIIQCSRDQLLVSSYQNGEEIQRINMDIPAYSSGCMKIIIIHEYMELYIQTSDNILIYNLAYIINGPFFQKFQNRYQESTNSIKPINSKLNMYLFRNSESKLILIDQNTHNSFLIYQNLQTCSVQDYFIFYDNCILMKCSQYKILLYQHQIKNTQLESLPINSILQQKIQIIQILIQSIFFPQVFYIINAPNEILVLRFQKLKSSKDVMFQCIQASIPQKQHIKDILMISRLITIIAYFDGSFQLCNPLLSKCNSLIVNDFTSFINGFAINPLNPQKIFFYSNSGQINLYQITFNQDYFLNVNQVVEEEINCKSLSNIKYPNSDFLSSLPINYKEALKSYLEKQSKIQDMNDQIQLDEIDFINAELIFNTQLIDQKSIITEGIDEFHIFQNIKIFITPVFSQGLIYIWDLDKFQLLNNIQVPSLSFNSYIKICSTFNSFFLSTCIGLNLYQYNQQNSNFLLQDSFYKINDPILNPRTNFLNYFADFQIVTSLKGYQIINFNNSMIPNTQKFIQKIKIVNPIIVSVEMVTDQPLNSQVNLIVFGFSNHEIFWHYINLKQIDSCIMKLDSYGLNEIQEELNSIEKNQEIQNFKVSKFKINLLFQDVFYLLYNIPIFKYSKQSTLNISGISQIKFSIASELKNIQIFLNWNKLILQNIKIDNSTVQINSSISIIAKDVNNSLIFNNAQFNNFNSDLLFNIQYFNNITFDGVILIGSQFNNQTLFQFYECNFISLVNFEVEGITANNFTIAQFLGRFTALSFQYLFISQLQIMSSNITNSELFVTQFGQKAEIISAKIKNNVASASILFDLQGIIQTTISKSLFYNNTSICLLNSSSEIAIDYDIYSQFQVYQSNFYLIDSEIEECQIDSSTYSILNFRKQKVFISNLNVSKSSGINAPIPLIFQIPYYNSSVILQEKQDENSTQIFEQQQQISFSNLFTIIKCYELIHMEIKNSNFINIKGINHVIQSQDSQLINVIGCNFTQSGDKYSTNGLIYTETSILQIENSSFEDNVSYKCTNILILNSPIDAASSFVNFINNTRLINNKAYLFGGALCFSNSQLNLFNTDFIQNSGQFGGAVFYQNQYDYLQQINNSIQKNIHKNLKFINNSAAIFGINYDSGLSYMQAYDLDFDGQNYVIEDFRSGDSLSSLKILLFDQEQQLISNDQTNSLNFKIKPIKLVNLKIINQSDFEQKIESGISYLTNDRLRIFGIPGEVGYIYYTSDFIDNSQVDGLQKNQQPILQIKLKFRKCLIGEIQRLEFVDEQNKKNYYSCFQCPEGKYSLIEGSYDPNNNKKMCQLCPSDKATFCEKDIIKIKSGFWRENNMTDIIIECKNNPDACLGEDKCLEGHIGPLCEDCDITGEVYGKKYTRINNEVFSCTQCENNFAQIFIMFLLQAAITGYLVWSIKTSLDRSKQIVMADLMRKMTLVSLGKSSQTNSTSAFIKIIAHYVQVISCLKYYHPQYPSFGLLYVDYIGDPVDKSTFAFDCILIDFEYLKIPFEYLIIIWSQIYQIIYLVLYLSIYFCLIKMKKVQYKQYANRNAIIFFILYIQNSVISQLVSSISCRRIGENSYIRSAISKMCFTHDFYDYSFKLIIPLLFFWALLVPLIGFCLIFRIRKKLFTFFNTLNYGLLYLDYKPQYYYWEFIRIIIKITLIFIVNYFYQSIYYQGIISLLIILIYSYSLQNLQPYKEKFFNELEQKSAFIQSTFFFLVLVQSGLEIQQYSYLSWVIVIINLLFLVYLIYLCISYQITKQQVYIFLYKIPFLRKCVENKIPQQPRIFNAQQLWRSLSIYVRDFIERKKLNKNAEFYVQHLQLGSSQSNLYRVSQVKTSQQFKEILKKSTQLSVFLGDQREVDTKHDTSLNLNKLQVNEIITESRVIGKFDAISEEIQEEDPEIQSEKNNDQIPQQLNQIIIPDFYPNQTKLQIEQQSDRIKTEEILDTQANEENKILKTEQSFINNVTQPSIISPQNNLSNSNQMLIKQLFQQQQKTEEDLDLGHNQNEQTKQIPRNFKVKENNLNRQQQIQKLMKKQQNKQQNQTNHFQQQQESKVIASLFTPRNNENQSNNPVQSYREAFAEKMKKTISFRSAQKQ